MENTGNTQSRCISHFTYTKGVILLLINDISKKKLSSREQNIATDNLN